MVLLKEDLEDRLRQQIATELKTSETAFLEVKDGGDHRTSTRSQLSGAGVLRLATSQLKILVAAGSSCDGLHQLLRLGSAVTTSPCVSRYASNARKCAGSRVLCAGHATVGSTVALMEGTLLPHAGS